MDSFVVYKHTLKSDGRVYIGQTKDPEIRWMPCRYKRSWYFYNAIKKYGWDSFEHEILLDGLTKVEADVYEALYIAQYRANEKGFGFNLHCGGRSRSGKDSPTFGMKHTEETRRKMSEAHKGWKMPQAQKEKISKAMAGRVSPLKGAALTEEHKSRIRSSHKKSMKKVLCVDTGVIYESMHEATRKTGVDYRNISACCHGRIKSCGGYVWRFV